MSTPAWLSRNLVQPCVVRNRVVAGKDAYGNDTYDHIDVPSTCWLQPVSGAEIQEGRTGVSSFLAHLPADMADRVDEHSQLIAYGVTYEADGPPMIVHLLRQSAVHHVELSLTRAAR